MSSTPTAAEILRHTTAFLRNLLSQTPLRRRLLAAAFRKSPQNDKTTLKTLILASQTLEASLSATTTTSSSSSSLHLTQATLLSFPSQTPLSALLLSLIYALGHRPVDAALRLLDIFVLDPSSARTEFCHLLFEELFIVHLLPVLQWFKDRRERVLAGKSRDMGRSRSGEGMGVLSRMSGGQAAELKEVEREYGEVVDENSRAFAIYLKEVLEGKEAGAPQLVWGRVVEGGGGGERKEKRVRVEENGLEKGRFNPIWVEEESPSADFDLSNSTTSSKSPHSYPIRVSSLPTHPTISFSPSNSALEQASSSSDDDTSTDSEPQLDEMDQRRDGGDSLVEINQTNAHKEKQPVSEEASCFPEPVMEDSDNVASAGKQTPPKDFVCPITSQIFVDPVTLETGQTYERKAIQEWLDRGNSACPITRQKLQSGQLPKTNYVLKRLIASWQERNPGLKSSQPETPPREQNQPEVLAIKPSPSPTSVISQATIDGTLSELRIAISQLCTSDVLNESEMAVLRIERYWQVATTVPEIQTSLSKPAVINGFVEIMFSSLDPRVLRATVFLLSELASRDKAVIQTLTRVESDVECIITLFKKGLLEAVVLIYLLKPPWSSLGEMDMIEPLLMVIKKKDGDVLDMCLRPKTASVLLLGQILRGVYDHETGKVAQTIISEKAIESIVGSLEADWVEERISAVGILLKCMEEDGNCRNIIADKAELAPVLEIFVGSNDSERFEIVHFLSELVKLNRRTFNEQLLHIIKDEGAFSTMHSLLIYLQTALQHQCPVIASLLLQLDLLAEPRKMSIYREEAIDALISCLRNSEFPATQIAAAETIGALHGRFSSSGTSLCRAFLLKRAGFEKNYRVLMRAEKQSHVAGESVENLEEENAAEEWERKMAFVLVSHEFGLLFEVLSEGLNSRYADLSQACFVSATWLIHMLTLLPNTGIRGAARVCLLKRFISIFKSARDPEDKALAMLALSSFRDDPDGLQDLTIHVKGILKGLRELKKSSALASEMLKVLAEGQDSTADFWSHKELVQVDCSSNGEVMSITCFRDKIFSGHSDGTIKVWTGRGSLLHLSLEIREHSKAVTSLVVLSSGEKLYSGSLDKTVRVWSIGEDKIQCIQSYDFKDQVHNLAVANTISCFVPNGAGVKVQSWSGSSKLLNPNKHVKSLALVQGKLYCGCNDSSIQEIDLVSGTLSTIQTGSRKLLGKTNPINALQVRDGLLYSATSSLDGAAVKIWSTANYNLVGSLPSTLEVRAMAISSELIYLGCKFGTVEIWSKDKHDRVGALQTGTSGKILCMDVNEDGDFVVAGTSDGRIQVITYS